MDSEEWDANARRLVQDVENFAVSNPHDIPAQADWARQRSSEERAAFYAFRENTPVAHTLVPGRPLLIHHLDLALPTLADFSFAAREMLLGVCFPLWEKENRKEQVSA